MSERPEAGVAEELESRLDIFFREDEGVPGSARTADQSKAGYFQEIKSILLSIDWEITDEIMTQFVDLLTKMEHEYREDKNVRVFLQIILSIAKYIRVNKARAHPGVMKVLNSACSAMERVNLGEDIAEEEKERILLTEVKRFKNLKKQITASRPKGKADTGDRTPEEDTSLPERKRSVIPLQKEDPPAGPGAGEVLPDLEREPMLSHEVFTCAMEEIKSLIRAEFRALRAELRQ